MAGGVDLFAKDPLALILDKNGANFGSVFITTDQAEAYANERVREALENAAQVILGGIGDESLVAAPTTRRNAANEVLALIPKQ